MIEKINNNEHPYVDLDLPSGTLWATCNVGANKPTDYGLYFQWGDTKGYTNEQVGKEKAFKWADYKLSINGSFLNFSKYATPGTMLELEDDAAHVNMGGDWHMPEPYQIKELIDNTTSEWTKQDGINGRLFTSNKDDSKSIFIPAAGSSWYGLLSNSGKYGNVWSSMLNRCSARSGKYLYFYQDSAFLSYSYFRCDGLSVRGVIG